MQTTVKHNHDSKTIHDALGITENRKDKLMLQLISVLELTTKKSQVLSAMIIACNTPEELAWVMFEFGELNACSGCPIQQLNNFLKSDG